MNDMGVVTATVTDSDYFGGKRWVKGVITMSSTYTSGGDTWTPGLFGLESVDIMDLDDAGATNTTTVITAPLNVVYPTTTGFSAAGGKLQAFGAGAGATGLTQIAGNTDLSGYTVNYSAIGW